jgi:hypothetical protein
VLGTPAFYMGDLGFELGLEAGSFDYEFFVDFLRPFVL